MDTIEAATIGGTSTTRGIALTATGAKLFTEAAAIGVGVSNALAGVRLRTSILALTTTSVTTTVGTTATVGVTTAVTGTATGLGLTLGSATPQVMGVVGGVALGITGVPLALAGAGLLGYGI